MFASCAAAIAMAGFVCVARPSDRCNVDGRAGRACGRDICARRARVWVTAGIGYAGALLFAPVLLRADDMYGFAAIVLLFAIVWTTDVVGLFRRPRLRRPKIAAGGQSEENLVGRDRGRDRRHPGRAGRREPVRVVQQSGDCAPSRLFLSVCRNAAICSNPGSSANSAPRMQASSFPVMAA